MNKNKAIPIPESEIKMEYEKTVRALEKAERELEEFGKKKL